MKAATSQEPQEDLQDFARQTQDIFEFMEAHTDFVSGHIPKRQQVYYRNGEPYAWLWFKLILGGWRLSIKDEPQGAWEDRGPITSVEQLKWELNIQTA